MNHADALATAKEVFEDIARRAQVTRDSYILSRAKTAAESIGRIINKESK